MFVHQGKLALRQETQSVYVSTEGQQTGSPSDSLPFPELHFPSFSCVCVTRFELTDHFYERWFFTSETFTVVPRYVTFHFLRLHCLLVFFFYPGFYIVCTVRSSHHLHSSHQNV